MWGDSRASTQVCQSKLCVHADTVQCTMQVTCYMHVLSIPCVVALPMGQQDRQDRTSEGCKLQVAGRQPPRGVTSHPQFLWAHRAPSPPSCVREASRPRDTGPWVPRG